MPSGAYHTYRSRDRVWASPHMDYRYVGYLSTILYTPDPGSRSRLEHITLSADDLSVWPAEGLPAEKEWQMIPASRKRGAEGVELTGRFNDMKRIDNISVDDLGFWVAMSTLSLTEAHMPVDTNRLPILEITYRCKTENAQPSIVYLYDGGYQEAILPTSSKWTTAVLRVSYQGFPASVRNLILRVYSTTRTTETAEFQSITFRAMTPEEAEACEKERSRSEAEAKAPHYRVLDEFVPLGTFMDVDRTRRLAQMLGISTDEYWRLAVEDIVRHHHNCIALENTNALTPAEWAELLDIVQEAGVRILAMCDLPLEDVQGEVQHLIDTFIAPHAASQAILGWSLVTEPPEHIFPVLLQAKRMVEAADPNHPVVAITRHPTGYPLLAPYFAASGMTHYTSHAPWEMGDSVRAHHALCGGQQFWAVAPAFVYATGTPEWHGCPEMRLMVNTAFANGARGWFSFAYHNDPFWVYGSFARTLTGPFLAFSDIWMELDQRMERFNTLAPLFLHAKPARLPQHWYATGYTSSDHFEMPEGKTAIESYRLKGEDFNLYFIISNDIRGMASVSIDIPPEAMHGLQIFDVTDFISLRKWTHMNLERRLEMFPGQARMLLVGDEDVCRFWRDALAWRLIENDRRQLRYNLQIVEAHQLNTGEVHQIIDSIGSGDILRDLAAMDRAHDMVLNMIYDHADIAEARSKIIEASAAVCGCDGALCRMMNRGQVDQARELGLNVLPLAREFTQLRLAFRDGKSSEILDHARDLAHRAQKVLEDIRRHNPK